MTLNRRRAFTLLAAAIAMAPFPVFGQARHVGVLYKTPGCTCCDGHARHLAGYGFNLRLVETEDLDSIKAKHGVPPELAGCHTIVIGDRVVEGHVPGDVALDFLAKDTAAGGIALAGMPDGSPGMSGLKREPFQIFAFGDGKPWRYAVR